MTIAPTQSNIQAALNAFVAATLPGVLVVSGQNNRVPEPPSGDFIVMTPIFFDRIETSWDTAADCRFTGHISGTTLVVEALQIGSVVIGAILFGTGVAPGTTIVNQTSGSPGQIGNYTVSISQSLSGVLSSGQVARQQNMEWRVQLDFHSNGLDAGDLAATFVTLFRSVFATDFFESTFGSIDALYADEARQIPFINAEQQYEWRWVVEVLAQVNHVVTLPQQYADAVAVQLIELDGVDAPVPGGSAAAMVQTAPLMLAGLSGTLLGWPDGTLVTD